MATKARRRITLNDVHKWAGLTAALWMAVLAVTGLMQLHRNDWQWQWQSGVPLSESHAHHDDKYLWRYHQIDPVRPNIRVMAGTTGAYWTRDGGKSWTALAFNEPDGTRRALPVGALEPASHGGHWTVYAATNDGVWRLDEARLRFVRAGLKGDVVSGLSVEGDRLAAATSMSRLHLGVIKGDAITWTAPQMGDLPTAKGPPKVEWGRFLQDIHLGRGLFGGMIDTWLWSLVAVGLFTLSVTGVLYWAVMGWCNRSRRRPKEARPSSAAMKRAQKVIQYSFRAHAMVVGIALAPFLLLVFITGIYQDHRKEAQMMLRQADVPSFLLTPSYRGSSWRGNVGAVALARDAKGDFIAIAHRRGVFVSRDGARSWQRDAGFIGPAMRLRKIHGELYVPGRMVRRVQVRRDGRWQVLDAPRPVVMANEMSAGPKGQIWWTRRPTMFKTTTDGAMRGKMATAVPRLGYLPWASFAAELHEGALFSKHWKWINDLFALLGIALIVTGFLRWRKRRW